MALNDLEGVNDGNDVQPENYDEEEKQPYVASGWVELDVLDTAPEEPLNRILNGYPANRVEVSIPITVSFDAFPADEHTERVLDAMKKTAENVANNFGTEVFRYSDEMDQITVQTNP